MAFVDWTTNTSAGTGAWALEPISPIQAAQSLIYIVQSNATPTGMCGLTAGVPNECVKIRTLAKQVTNAGAPSSISPWGVFSHIQGSFAQGSSAYWAALIDAGSDTRVVLNKATVATAMGSVSGVQAVAITRMLIDEVYALELYIQRDPGTGNMVLLASTDGPIANPNTYDFSTLVPRVSYTDTTSVYTTGVTAGVAVRSATPGGSGVYYKNYFDVTWIDTD